MRKLFFSFLVIVLATSVLAPPALAQGGVFSGEVRDDKGELREGALVVMESETARPPRLETTSDGNGRFIMLGLNSGAWTLTVELEGYHLSVDTVSIHQGANAAFNVVLERIKHPLELALGEAALEGLDPVALQETLNAADDAFNNEQWEEAITAYQELLGQLPMVAALHIQIGTAMRGLERYDEAIAAFEEAAAADSNLAESAQAEIARTRMAMGDFEAASEALEAAAAGAGAAREDLYNLGELEFAKGDVEAAATFYERAAELDPTWEKPWFKLALVALNTGDMATAKAHFARVVELNPDSADAATAKATLDALP